ncbi:membrane hypothetical protein [Carnobacterium maltaromaticum]|nr:membrane hypothetical protein [Carnobacterium maltaromaticum]
MIFRLIQDQYIDPNSDMIVLFVNFSSKTFYVHSLSPNLFLFILPDFFSFYSNISLNLLKTTSFILSLLFFCYTVLKYYDYLGGNYGFILSNVVFLYYFCCVLHSRST